MIKDFEFKLQRSFLWLTWKTPQYLPTHYVLQYSLIEESFGVVYPQTKHCLSSHSYFFVIPNNVFLGSSCKVNLKAVYNSATLDKGITKLIGPADPPSKRIN